MRTLSDGRTSMKTKCVRACAESNGNLSKANA